MTTYFIHDSRFILDTREHMTTNLESCIKYVVMFSLVFHINLESCIKYVVMCSLVSSINLESCIKYVIYYNGPGGIMVIYMVNLLPPPVFSTPGTLH
jgi:hypothetical protein